MIEIPRNIFLSLKLSKKNRIGSGIWLASNMSLAEPTWTQFAEGRMRHEV